jgi:hypothetical protein
MEQADWIRIPNTHEAIIDAETWARTQARLRSNGRVGKRSQELSPLSGKVKCAVCGRPMKRNVYYNKAKTIKYYGLQCATYKTGAMNCTNKKSISGLVLEKKILDELNSIVEQYCQADKIQLRDIYSEQLKQLEADLARLNERHSSAKGRLLAMYKDKLDGVISDEDYALFRQSLSDEEHELSARIADTAKHIEECCERIRNTEGQRSIIEKYTHFDKLDRNIADEFIDYVEIGESSENGEREIHIHWKL